jgi:hypothetical protein
VIVLKPKIFLKNIMVLIFLLVQSALAIDELNWDTPSDSLLTQQYCPIDSAADAMVIQKETVYRIERQGKYRVIMTTRRRIKIYTEAGLRYADITLPYYHYRKLRAIEATCYNYQSDKKELDKDDIHDELWVKDSKKDIKLDAKSFAIPAAKAGSVIDISYEVSQRYIVFMPPFVFQEEIPVEHARVNVIIPDHYIYQYFISNPELIDVKTLKKNKNPVLTAYAEDVPAIEDEMFRPPLYNISTKMWLKMNKYETPHRTVEIASSWDYLLHFYHLRERYAEILRESGKVGKIAGEMKQRYPDKRELIVALFHKVRDEWANRLYGSVYMPFDTADKMLEMETLDAESKATLLCSMLRHAGIESHVIWICSDEDGLRDFPSFAMFDHALTYIPSLDLYLDPCDPGSEVGVIDLGYYDKLALNITSASNELFYTAGENRKNGTAVDMLLRLDADNSLKGEGNIIFKYQSAIEARRKMRAREEHERMEWVNDLLFSELRDGVVSLTPAPDSLQSPEEYRLNYQIDLADFILPAEDYPEIFIYPGNTFEQAAIDDKPPRNYPVYYGASYTNLYKIVWDFGDYLRPLNFENINFKRGLSVVGSFMADYDESENKLTVTRKIKNRSSIYKASVSSGIEKTREKLKEQDITSVILERK